MVWRGKKSVRINAMDEIVYGNNKEPDGKYRTYDNRLN